MTKSLKDDWEVSKVIDDVEFNEEDAKQFQELLKAKEQSADEGSAATMVVGQILKGRIVELTKDFGFIDVGLKS